MSKSTADLFRWAEKKTARRGTTKWHPKRRNGFAAALAVVVEAGRRGVGTRPLPPVTLGAPSAPRWAVMPRAAKSADVPAAASSAPMVTPSPPVRPEVVAAAGKAPAAPAAPTLEVTAHCPRCGVEGGVDALFGYRRVDGKRRAQSWCRACRRNARSARKSPLVQEAEAFARTTVEALGGDELPLWSRGSGK